MWAVHTSERSRISIQIDAIAASVYGLRPDDLAQVLEFCDYSTTHVLNQSDTFPAMSFWRVDKDRDPELRRSVLTFIAFKDLQQRIEATGGDRIKGLEAFLDQNDGQGWMLPGTLRLADYGLGHDDRAKEHQPVASRLGPRFYDWQLGQSPEESWRECHLHARNLLGEAGYRRLLAETEMENRGEKPSTTVEPELQKRKEQRQSTLF